MLRFTGHPLVDVGVATIVAFAGKSRPEDLVEDDLAKVAEYIADLYVSPTLTPYLSSVFTMNAVYTQPSWKEPQRREKSAELVQCYKEDGGDNEASLRCHFSGEVATRLAYRQHIPMVTGEGILNFFPAGLGGIPVSGKYLLALQVLPLGCRRSLGRLLAVHSPDDPELTMQFAKEFLADNRRIFLLSQESEEKYLDAKAPKTLIISTFLEIDQERKLSKANGIAPSVSVYHLSNDGRDPSIAVYHLPAEVVSFLRFAKSSAGSQIWNKIEVLAWQKAEAAKKQKGKKTDGGQQPILEAQSKATRKETHRNFLYEDLFSLPARASSFIRTYFLRRANRHATQNDPRGDHRLSQELELINWPLTDRFLQEILQMEKSRINAIREFADRLAAYIKEENDRPLFQKFHRISRYGELRVLLIKASNGRLKSGLAPIVDFEEFVQIFENPDSIERLDWNLARDLILIRLIEQLYQSGWFGDKSDLLEDEEEKLALELN